MMRRARIPRSTVSGTSIYASYNIINSGLRKDILSEVHYRHLSLSLSGSRVVAFEAPAERLASARLHLTSPVRPFTFPALRVLTYPSSSRSQYTHLHFSSRLAPGSAPRAMVETRSHLNQTVKYNTIAQLGKSTNTVHLVIVDVIDGVLAKQAVDWTGNGTRGARGR